MPGILQSRLLRLIEAAETFARRDSQMRERLAYVCAQHSNGRWTASQAVEEMALFLKTTPMYHPADKTITEERVRYDTTYRRNTVARERIRVRRAAAKHGGEIQPLQPIEELKSPHPPTRVQHVIDQMQEEDTAINDWLNDEPPKPEPPPKPIPEPKLTPDDAEATERARQALLDSRGGPNAPSSNFPITPLRDIKI